MMFQPEPDPECCSANAFLKSIIGIIIILGNIPYLRYNMTSVISLPRHEA